MDKLVQYAAEASRLLDLVQQIAALAQASFNRMAQTNAAPITDDDLAALAAQRREAVERLAKLAQ